MQPSPSEVLALGAVRRAVRSALDPDRPWDWPPGLRGDAFLHEARRQRVVTLLADADLELPAEVRAAAVRQRDEARLTALRQIHDYRVLDRAFASAGVRWMAFKGLPLAVQSAGSFTARGAGDIDLLVPPDDVAAVHAMLTDLGWLPHPDEHHPTPSDSWAWRHTLSTTYELPYVSDSSAVDLHWRLDASRHALPAFDEAWARRTVVSLGGVDIATLSRRDAFQHSATHAAKDSWHFLRSVVDVRRLAASADLWGDGSGWLRRIDLVTLRVVAERLGLPEAVPREVVARVAALPPRVLREAEAATWRFGPRGSYPGSDIVHSVRARTRSSRHPTDVWRQVYWALLPSHRLSGLDGQGTTSAVLEGLSRGWRELRGR